MTITEPGVYDLPADVYHADPIAEGSLSQSRAKVLLDEAGPAKFHAQETEPRVEKAEWDLGTAVHALLLGKGEEQLVEIDADSWRTKAAQQERAQAYLDRLTPLLTKDMSQAREIVGAVPRYIHDLLDGGLPERSMFWRHPSGLWLRGQMDMYQPSAAILDVKTMRDTSTRGFRRSVWDLRYYMQAAWYRRGVEALTGDLLPYLIVGVEKTAPYLARVMEVSPDYLTVGEAHMDQAIDTYLECVETDQWPGHPERISQLTPPPWAYDDLAEATVTALEALTHEGTA